MTDSEIIGIGMDQISCSRMKKACEKDSFLNKCYSGEEQQLFRKSRKKAATNFAGKEAVAKAFGTGFAGISPKEIEILRRENGAPYVRLSGRARERAEALGIVKIHISLTDTEEYASAFVIAVGKGAGNPEEKEGYGEIFT